MLHRNKLYNYGGCFNVGICYWSEKDLPEMLHFKSLCYDTKSIFFIQRFDLWLMCCHKHPKSLRWMFGWLHRLFVRYQNNISAWIWTLNSTFILFRCQSFWTFSLETATSTHQVRSVRVMMGEEKGPLKSPFPWYISLTIFMRHLCHSILTFFCLQHCPPLQAEHILQQPHYVIVTSICVTHGRSLSPCSSSNNTYFLEVTVYGIVTLLSHQKGSFLCPWFCPMVLHVTLNLYVPMGNLNEGWVDPSHCPYIASLGVEPRP
jgi:hypothetical protein